MAGAGGGMTVLPQYQGDYLTLQRQQALAQALTQQALQPQQIQATGSGQYTVMPKYNIGAGLTQLGQALLAAKLGNQVSQGYQQLGANQAAAFGFGQQQPQGNPQTGTAPNPFAGDQEGAADGSAAAGSPAPAAAPQSSVSPMNPAGLPPALAYMGYANDPGKYFETQAQFFKPADIVAQIRAAGIDPNSAIGKQIAQNALAKQVAPDYVSLRPGGYSLNKSTGQVEQMPQVPEGFTAVQGPNGWQIVPVQGGTSAMSQSAAAKAGGQAQYQLREVWDPNANDGKGGYIQQTVANVAGAAGAPLPSNGLPATQDGTPNGSPMTPLQRAVMSTESFGNPKAVSPKGASGTMQTMPTTLLNPGFGVRPAQNNSPAEMQRVGVDFLEAMRQKYGNDTDALVAYNMGPGAADKWISGGRQWSQLPQETQGYIGKTLTQANNFTGAAAKPSGPMASQPPLGTSAAANASQGAPSELMDKSYKSLSDADNAYQQSREALTEMITLANNKGASGAVAGVLPESISTKVSPDAAKYQKLHATYVASQGKALGAGGTDASRATIDEAVPTYDKPQSAMISGLTTQLNNLDMGHLKTQFLSPIYQQGNEKNFTAQSAAFDQNIKPSMMPVLQMSGPQQQAAVRSAIKANPSLRPNFEWAFNNGMLK